MADHLNFLCELSVLTLCSLLSMLVCLFLIDLLELFICDVLILPLVSHPLSVIVSFVIFYFT